MFVCTNKRGWLFAISLLIALQSAHAASFENGVLSANGGHHLFASLGEISISEGTYSGNDGGIAAESTLLQSTPDAYVSEIHSSGGAGIYITGTTQLNGISNSTFTGGNAGQSTGISTNANAFSNGGQGASVSSYSSIIGEAQRNGSTAFETLNSGILSTMGGSGSILVLGGTGGHVTAVNGNEAFLSGSGSTLTISEGNNLDGTMTSASFTASSGTSLTIYDGNLLGGSGGSASFTNTLVVTGGTGLSLLNTNITFVDGIFTGGFGGIATGTLPTAYEINNSTFTGGDAGYAEGRKNAEAEGGAGLYLDNVSDISIGAITATAGNGGQAIGSRDIIVRGGNGFAVHTSTNLAINGGDFRGGNGGAASLSATNHNFHTMDASGGTGIMGTSIQQTTLQNVVSTGGNGGTADSGQPDLPTGYTSRMHADGGAGASFNNQYGFQTFPNPQRDSESSLVQDSTFTGGNGGTLIGGNIPGAFWINSPSARGGNGLEMYGYYFSKAHTNQLVLKNVTARGGNGGDILLSGEIVDNSYSWKNAGGGDGATIQRYDHVVIDGGVYQGGKGGHIEYKAEPPVVLPNGNTIIAMSSSGNSGAGRGMSIAADHATILNGTFQGGGSLSGFRTGGGLYFSGDTLEIHDGQFNASEKDLYAGEGLYAHVVESLNIHGGNFNSIGISGNYWGHLYGPDNVYSTDYIASNQYSDVYISSNAVVAGQTRLSGSIRVSEIDPGTWQNTVLSWGNFLFEDHLVLDEGSYFSSQRPSSFIASDATLRPGSTMMIYGNATFNELELQNRATLLLRATQYTLISGGVGGFLHEDDTHILADTISFEDESQLLFDGWHPFMPIGTTQTVANLTADEIMMHRGTNTYDMSQEDLDSLSSVAGNNYLTSYDFTISSSPTQQQITVEATGLALTGKKDNPLPHGLSLLIDAYRSGTTTGLSAEDSIQDLLWQLENPSQHRTLKRYFNTTASPMVVSAVQAGQQAQLNQVLQHVDSFRKAGGLASSRPSPKGAAGPIEGRKGWSGWMKGYGSDITKDPDSDFTGYDANIAGAVIGIEKAFGNSLIGVAGGTARTDIETDDSGSSDADTYFGSIYGSCGSDTCYIDTSLSYGHSRVEAKRTLLPTIAEAEYDAHNIAGYIGGGREYRINDKLAITPEAGAQISYYHQESFTETGGPLGSNLYDSYNYWSYKSIVGANTTMDLPLGESLNFQPSLHLQWRHEFNSDPDKLSYTTQGVTDLEAAIQSPEKDMLVIGGGLTTTVKDRVNIDLRIDQQLADGWESTTYSGSLKFHF